MGYFKILLNWMIFAYRQMWDFLSYFYEKCWIVTPFYKRDLLLSFLVYHKERVLFGVQTNFGGHLVFKFLPVAYMNKIELWKLKARDGAFRNMVGNCQPQILQWPGSVLTYDFYIYLGPISDLTWFYICLRLIQAIGRLMQSLASFTCKSSDPLFQL